MFNLTFFISAAQKVIILSLSEAVKIAQSQSIDSKLLKIENGISKETYSLQRAQFFPQINFNSSVPGYNSSITSVTQPDGTIKFTTVEQAFSTMGVSLTQILVATGGSITASSNINRFDRLTGNRSTNFNTQPFVLGLNQPLFRFNESSFILKNANINYLISSKIFIKRQEELALKVSTLFHIVLSLQTTMDQLSFAQNSTDTLLLFAKQKLVLGKIEEDEFLQLQIEQSNTKMQLMQTVNNYRLAKNNLLNLLNLNDDNIDLVLVPTEPSSFELNSQQLLTTLFDYFKLNNPQFEQYKLGIETNKADIKRAKLNRLPNINLVAGYGSNQSAANLNDAYQNVLTQQNVTLGISMPLYTSGTNTANLKIAAYQQQNLQLQFQQFEQQILNDLLKQLQTYEMASLQINTAHFADSISQRRYEISHNKYIAGKINYTDLLIAQNQQLQAKQGYVNAIAAYWQAYYQLRVTTMYDIEKQEDIYKKE